MKSESKKPLANDEVPAGVPHGHDHTLAEATALSGAVAGAVVGSVAGPIGAAVGGVVGGALGAFGGAAMEIEEHRQEAHDHELDEAIGVTRGSLGVPAEAKVPSRRILDEAEELDREHAAKVER